MIQKLTLMMHLSLILVQKILTAPSKLQKFSKGVQCKKVVWYVIIDFWEKVLEQVVPWKTKQTDYEKIIQR